MIHPSYRILLIALGCLLLPLAVLAAPQPGDRVDLAEFGRPLVEPGSVGVEWDNPRDVQQVQVLVERGGDLNPAGLSLEWWGSVWPNNGTGGWKKLDDPWNGRWIRVKTEPRLGSRPHSVVLKFPVLTNEEWKIDSKASLKDAITFRRILKLRIVFPKGTDDRVLQLSAFGSSVYREGRFEVECRPPEPSHLAGSIEVTNGKLLSPADAAAKISSKSPRSSWTLDNRAGQPSSFPLHLLYADNPDRDSNDLTRVTVRIGNMPEARGFSFVPQDVGGGMNLPDFNMNIKALERKRIDVTRLWEKTVRQRVAEHTEATYQSAMAGIPRLHPPRWVPLGVPSARQEIVVSPAGDWSMWRESLWTDGKDRQRSVFRPRKGNLDAILDTSAEPRFKGSDREGLKRYLEGDCLPLIHADWHTGPIHYEHRIAATILLGDLGDDDTRRGDETVVMLSKLTVHNTATTPQDAFLHLRYSDGAAVKLDPDGIVAITPPNGDRLPDGRRMPDGLTALRGQLGCDRGNPIAGWSVKADLNKGQAGQMLSWRARLEPGEARTVYFKAPYVDLLDATELARLKVINYEQEVPKVLEYWRKRIAGGMQIEVPEAALNSFVNANLWHVLITTDRDPQTGLYNQGVGTFAYKVFANETVMIARSMDMRGEHKEAERFLEPMLRYQGHEPLTGRFSTQDGVFHSAGAYTHGQYAMNHGFVLWGIADHYFYTRDRAYLDRVAPQIIKGCDFVINERKSTMLNDAEGHRLPYYGLAPASSLEDVIEFQYWFPTNGYFYLGMKRVAEALADTGHPEAERIAREAEGYRHDIEHALREAATKAAVVRLRNGTCVPYVPSRVGGWRHLTEGWIREALYSAVDMVPTRVLKPTDPLVTWILDDLEDSIFPSAESGYDIKDFDHAWFERGAVTLQPCLVDTPMVYMARDEVPAALRSFWNTYALSIYSDVHCFAEWAKTFGQAGGPVYKTSDESRFVMWLRNLLVWENGDQLWLTRGTPRSWLADGKEIRIERAATSFGSVSAHIKSDTAHHRVTAVVQLPNRNLPREVWLRLRHPEGIKPVRVRLNGKVVDAGDLVGEDVRITTAASGAPGKVQVEAEYP